MTNRTSIEKPETYITTIEERGEQPADEIIGKIGRWRKGRQLLYIHIIIVEKYICVYICVCV